MNKVKKQEKKEHDRFQPSADYVAKDLKGTTGVLPPVFQFVSNSDVVEETVTETEEQTQESFDSGVSAMPPPADNNNNKGLPAQLQANIEQLSGFSMDQVKVHYNSSKPQGLNARAYAQGTDIHLASGEEKHLPHEAWHVVQQMQGRVKATTQMNGNVNINDNSALEKEADKMGEKAISGAIGGESTLTQKQVSSGANVKQMKFAYDESWKPGLSWYGVNWTQEDIDKEKAVLDVKIDSLYDEVIGLANHNYIQHLEEFPKNKPTQKGRKSSKGSKGKKGRKGSQKKQTAPAAPLEQTYGKKAFGSFKEKLETLLLKIESKNKNNKPRRSLVEGIQQNIEQDYKVTWGNRSKEMEWLELLDNEYKALKKEIENFKPAAKYQSDHENRRITAAKDEFQGTDPDYYLPKNSKSGNLKQSTFKSVATEKLSSTEDALLGNAAVADYEQRTENTIEQYKTAKRTKDSSEEAARKQKEESEADALKTANEKRDAEAKRLERWGEVIAERRQIMDGMATAAGIPVRYVLDFFDPLPDENQKKFQSPDTFMKRFENKKRNWPKALEGIRASIKEDDFRTLIPTYVGNNLYQKRAERTVNTALSEGVDKAELIVRLDAALHEQKNPTAERWSAYLGIDKYDVDDEIPTKVQTFSTHITYDANSIAGGACLDSNLDVIKTNLFASPDSIYQLHATLECNHLPDPNKAGFFLNPKVYYNGQPGRMTTQGAGQGQEDRYGGNDWDGAVDALKQIITDWMVANIDKKITDAKNIDGNIEGLRPPLE